MSKYDFVKSTFDYEKKFNNTKKFDFTSTHEIKKDEAPNKFIGGRNIRRVETPKEK